VQLGHVLLFGQAALGGLGAAQAQALPRCDPGVAVKLGELFGAGRGLEIFHHCQLDAAEVLENRQRLARGAASRIVPDRRLHGRAPDAAGHGKT
jgi:hypothetical protein